MKTIRLIASALALVMLSACLFACGGTNEPTSKTPASDNTEKTKTAETEKPATETGEASAETETAAATETPAPATPTDEPSTETPVEDPPYIFPENGVLGLLANGAAEEFGALDGNNPSFTGDGKILLFFDFATKNAGLDLADDTVINYTIKKSTSPEITGTSAIDQSVTTIKNDKGYIGLCFDVDTAFSRYESATFSISFTDKNGKEFFLNKKQIFKGISYDGVNKSKFDKASWMKKLNITTKINKQSVSQIGNVLGTDFTLTIALAKWDKNTSVDQIVSCAELFWYCYPRMYKRFGAAGQSPTSVTLAFENEGYGIASAGGNFVHIHDMWLRQNRNDFDCLTHEFAHVIQNGWNGDTCEYSGFIERFADCCRYLYAFEDGKINDLIWSLNTVEGENTRETSVRFLVWFDYFYSTEGNDLLLKFFTVCRSERYPSYMWGNAWAEIFEGSELEGLSIDEIWDMYVASDFAHLSAKRTSNKKPSPLLEAYNIREALAEREAKL